MVEYALLQIVDNVRKEVQQIAKREQELAEAKEAAEREKLMVHTISLHC